MSAHHDEAKLRIWCRMYGKMQPFLQRLFIVCFLFHMEMPAYLIACIDMKLSFSEPSSVGQSGLATTLGDDPLKRPLFNKYLDGNAC